ncbi:MAG: hypothetical protein V1899_05630 [Planctomycetota bacterium]
MMNLRHIGLCRVVAATLVLSVLNCLAPAAQAAERYWVGTGGGGGK